MSILPWVAVGLAISVIIMLTSVPAAAGNSGKVGGAGQSDPENNHQPGRHRKAAS